MRSLKIGKSDAKLYSWTPVQPNFCPSHPRRRSCVLAKANRAGGKVSTREETASGEASQEGAGAPVPRQEEALDVLVADAVAESLSLLEWPAISRQLASFCYTAMNAERFLQEGAPMGSTQVLDPEQMSPCFTVP